MQITEHQSIHIDNLISYNTNIRYSDILKLTHYISDNIKVLDLTQKDKIIFSEKNHLPDDTVNVNILIPVNEIIPKCEEFDYRPVFHLDNAVIIRHEGNWTEIHNTETVLHEFIENNNFKTVTSSYYIVVRNGNSNSEDCIIDICIGVEAQSHW